MVTVRGVTTSTCAPHLRPASCVPPGQARRSDDSCDSAVDGPTAGLILLLARRTRPAASRSTASRGGRFPGTNRADDGDGQPPRQSAMTKDTVDRHPRGKDRTRTAVALGGGRLANSAAKGVVMPVEKLPGGTHGTRTPPSMLGRIMTPLMVRFHRRAGDRFQGMDLLYLTTVGARPGRPRSPGLTTAREAGSSWRPREAPHNNPGWYHNIAAHPDEVRVEVSGKEHRVQVDQLEGKPREEAWAQVVERVPRFKGYLAKTDRQLPVLHLTPVS